MADEVQKTINEVFDYTILCEKFRILYDSINSLNASVGMRVNDNLRDIADRGLQCANKKYLINIPSGENFAEHVNEQFTTHELWNDPEMMLYLSRAVNYVQSVVETLQKVNKF